MGVVKVKGKRRSDIQIKSSDRPVGLSLEANHSNQL